MSATKQYLYRETERQLFCRGLKPLSAIKDMIGSQATKGMHVLAKFTRQRTTCGIWSDGSFLTAIETYPAPCKRSDYIMKLSKQVGHQLAHDDTKDAAICALVAHIFHSKRDRLLHPNHEVPTEEGWIWLPLDACSNVDAV